MTVAHVPCDCGGGAPSCFRCGGDGFFAHNEKSLADTVRAAASMLAERIESSELRVSDVQNIIDAATRCAMVASIIAPVEGCDHDVNLCSCDERELVESLVEWWTRIQFVELAPDVPA